MSIEMYKEMFLEEAKELFESASNILLDVENTNELSSEQMNQLFRDVHTLKGSGASVELSYFAKFTHEMENLMDQLRNGSLEFNPNMTGDMIDSLDFMQELLDMEVNGELDDIIYKDKTKTPLKIIKKLQNAKEKIGLKEIDSSKEKLDKYGFFDDQVIKSQGYTKIKTGIPKNSKKEEKNKNNNKITPTKPNENIRVDLFKIDMLMNNVGELVITNAMLKQYIEKLGDTKITQVLNERINLLERHIREMQDSIMGIRMVPMQFVYQKFPKMIRDTSKKLGKQIKFEHYGATVEIDKTMIEGLTDPLMHIVRNSIDHGIEPNEERKDKPYEGTIKISAEQTNGQIIITIEDDGNGIDIEKVSQKALENGVITEEQMLEMTDNEKAMLVFSAGLSTAEKITDISGRGVGMDVVKTNIENLEGRLSLETKKGIGTKINIELPLTLAILDGLEVEVGKENYIIPISSIIESLQPQKDMINHIAEGEDMLTLREEFIPIIKLYEVFNIKPKYEDFTKGVIVVVKIGLKKIGIFIDKFLNQHQIVVKPLDKNFKSVDGIAAATVSGSGHINLILDVQGLINIKTNQNQ